MIVIGESGGASKGYLVHSVPTTGGPHARGSWVSGARGEYVFRSDGSDDGCSWVSVFASGGRWPGGLLGGAWSFSSEAPHAAEMATLAGARVTWPGRVGCSGAALCGRRYSSPP